MVRRTVWSWPIRRKRVLRALSSRTLSAYRAAPSRPALTASTVELSPKVTGTLARMTARTAEAESKIGRSVGRRQHPAERQRSRVLARCGGYGEVVSGGVVEGDFLAGYPFEFGDELAFAAQRGEAVMPVGAEVGEAGGGVGEQVPDDGEDGVADGDQGAFLAAAPDDPLVAGGQEGPG